MILALLAMISGCETEEQYKIAKVVEQESSDRIVVKRLSIFTDSLAYRNDRGIYLIVDTETGKEYIGVSGIGIAESGSHTSGKVAADDER